MPIVKIAMIGVGAISKIYLDNITQVFKEIQLIGVCDLVRERAEKAQEAYNIPKLYENMWDAFKDEEVDIILNLTRPYEHFEVTKGALEAGKHVYTEKPLGASLSEGDELVRIAKEKGLMIAGAPDTFMGAGLTTCRHLIDQGFIGEPIGAAAFMICRGHETWHPDPAFYYQYGGGPMLDMGPYYVTALLNLLGRVEGVTGVVKKSLSQRVISSQPQCGAIIDVEVPTYINGILHFESGATATIFTTFDVVYKQQARFEVYGTRGTLIVPDPNYFNGPIQLLRLEDGEYKEVPLMFDYRDNSRGLGLADLAKAIETARDARASMEQLHHVLEILTGFERSWENKAYLPLKTPYQPCQIMKNNPIKGILD